MDAISDPSQLKFHEKLETPDKCITKYDKEEFLQAVKEKVSYYGLQKFFAVPTADRKMKILVLDFHILELDVIIKEYE